MLALEATSRFCRLARSEPKRRATPAHPLAGPPFGKNAAVPNRKTSLIALGAVALRFFPQQANVSTWAVSGLLVVGLVVLGGLRRRG